MELQMLEAVGTSGRVIVDDYFVTIIHDGEGGTLNKMSNRMNVGFAGEKRIPIDTVAAVQFKPVGGYGLAISGVNDLVGIGKISKELGFGATGFIQFSMAGAIERKSGGLGGWKPKKDENSVRFEASQQEAFEKIRNFIEEKIISRQSGRAIISNAQAPQASRLDQLKQLGELRAAGVLTDEEFEVEKKRIMTGE
jgi:hypothetical protein